MKIRVAELAEVVKSGNFVILDTETTGLDDLAEIVEIAVIEPDGAIIANQVVRPVNKKPDASGILRTKYNEFDVSHAGEWHIYDKRLSAAIGARTILTYNAEFDRRMMLQSKQYDPRATIHWSEFNFCCAMVAYAEFHGEWNDWSQSFKWKPLSHAARAAGVNEANAHTALGDCLTTLQVVNWLVKTAKVDVDGVEL